MINFFRRIRRKLANENQFVKYSRYAVGEILLVVIGILIALQINTWNQFRLDRIEEKNILYNMKIEFEQNKAAIEKSIQINTACFNADVYLMKLIGKSKSDLHQINVDSLLFNTTKFEKYTASENTIQDLLQSGRLQLLQSTSLKALLYQWTRINMSAEEHYNSFDLKIEQDFIPYLTSRYPLKDIDYYSHLKWSEKSKLEIDKLNVFSEISFENHLDDLAYRMKVYIDELEKINVLIDEVLITVDL